MSNSKNNIRLDEFVFVCVRVFAKDKDTSDQKSHFVFLFVLVINVKKRFNACKVWEQPSFVYFTKIIA